MRIDKKIDEFCYLLKEYILFKKDCYNEINYLFNDILLCLDIKEKYILDLEDIKKMMDLDIEMFLASDPAAKSKEEVIWCYPGIFSIMIYRVSHKLDKMGILILPRMLCEYAHSITGIDIHPKALIGHHFFIDHGTGIVIGETTIIGNYVKIYQGVTLGAISLSNAYELKNKKRHPTILDNVTIYANAVILGGNTVIGNNSIIGCNTYVTKSVLDNSVVLYK